MKLFGKDTVPETTGTDVLKAALRARMFKGDYLSILARELKVGILALQGWSQGSGTFPPNILDAMTKEFFGPNASFDPERNLLVSTPRPSTVLPDLRRTAPRGNPPKGPSGWPPIKSDKPEPVQHTGADPGWAE